MAKVVLTCILLVSVLSVESLDSSKKVNWPTNKLAWKPPFDTYSNYVKVPNKEVQFQSGPTLSNTTSVMADHYIHYMLTTYNGNKFSNAADIPIIFWFNGGPGCSSVGGMFTENGPFRISPQGQIYENVYAWNKLGHVVYIESPSDIGFSYATWNNSGSIEIVPKEIIWSDTTSGELNALVIHYFFVMNSDLAKNPYYITGESYAGVYIPEMTWRIKDGIQYGVDPNNPMVEPMKNNPNNLVFSNPNIKGIAIGNGYVNDDDIVNTLVLWQRYHGLIGIDRWNDLKKCCQSDPNITDQYPNNYDMDMCPYTDFIIKVRAGDYLYKNYSNSCDITVWLAIEELLDHTTPDAYNVYQQCYNKPSATAFATIAKSYRKAIVDRLDAIQNSDSSNPLWSPNVPPMPVDMNNYQALYNYQSTDALYGTPCFGDNATYDFLNDPNIQKALYIPQIWMDYKMSEWTDCDNFTYWSYNHDTQPGQDYHMQVILQPFKQWNNGTASSQTQQIKAMFYSGDVDTVCNFLSSERFVQRLVQNQSMTAIAPNVGMYNQQSYYNPSYPRKKWVYNMDSLSGQNQLAGFWEAYIPQKSQSVNNMPQVFVVTVNGAGHFVPLDRAGAARQMLNNFMYNSMNASTLDFSIPDGLSNTPVTWTTTMPTTPKPKSGMNLQYSILMILAALFLLH